MSGNLKKKKKEKLLKSFGRFKDDEFYFDQIEQYFRKKDPSEAFQTLSDRTCNDLDFQELFMFLDRTHSKVGQQFLYQQLRTFHSERDDLNQQERLQKELNENVDFRLWVQNHLEKLKDNKAFNISSLFQDPQLKQPDWFWLVRLMSFASLLITGLIFFNLVWILVLSFLFTLNIVVHYWNKRNVSLYLDSLPQLLRMNKVAHEFFKNAKLKEIDPELSKSLTVLNKVRNRMLFFDMEAKLQGEITVIFWFVIELIKILFLLEPLLLFSVLRQLEDKRNEIEKVFLFVGKIDMLVSIASLRKGLGHYCVPDFVNNGKELIAENIYHPLIPDCVENNIHVKGKSILLTGSNMSGKTTFIRTIGINVITGSTLNTCFADRFILPHLKLFSAIRMSDDLMNDKSYYFEEVLTIKEMIEQSENEIPNLFLLDEIFKGTNTVERISAGKAVLSSLTELNNIVFVSTHDIELADLLKDEYELYHFSEKVDHKTVDFDYKLKDGKLKTRNAIRILQLNNYPETVIEEALKLSRVLDQKRD